MRRIAITTALLLCASIAHAANAKVTVKRDDDKTVTVYTRTLPPPSVFQFMITTLREPAPPNACNAMNVSAFEIVTRSANEPRCVGKVNKP